MIVNHKAGEFVSGVMSRQYRTAFNVGVPVTGTVAGVLTGWLGPDFLFAVVPAAGYLATYLVNWKGRRYRIKPYELKKPTKTTEDEILELQDMYFHMPIEHRDSLAALLNASYEQIERGNIDAVIPRLEKAKALKTSIIAYNAKTDLREDIKQVDAAQKAMHRAIEA